MTEHADTDLSWLEQSWNQAGEAGEGTSPGPGFTAQSRACAREDAPPGPGSGPVSLAELLGPLHAAGARAAAAVTGLADRKDALLHEHARALRRHHECAGHFSNPLVRGGRVAYGWLHAAAVVTAADYLKWATRSPLSLTIHALLGFAVWLALRLGGYL